MFHKVYKVSPYSTTHKTQFFFLSEFGAYLLLPPAPHGGQRSILNKDNESALKCVLLQGVSVYSCNPAVYCGYCLSAQNVFFASATAAAHWKC